MAPRACKAPPPPLWAGGGREGAGAGRGGGRVGPTPGDERRAGIFFSSQRRALYLMLTIFFLEV